MLWEASENGWILPHQYGEGFDSHSGDEGCRCNAIVEQGQENVWSVSSCEIIRNILTRLIIAIVGKYTRERINGGKWSTFF